MIVPSTAFSRGDGAKRALDRQNQARVAAKNTRKTMLPKVLGADTWIVGKMGKTRLRSIGPRSADTQPIWWRECIAK